MNPLSISAQDWVRLTPYDRVVRWQAATAEQQNGFNYTMEHSGKDINDHNQ